MSEIAVVGAGAWGTSLCIALGRKGSHRIRLWAHEKEVRDSIASRRVNELFLPEHAIPDAFPQRAVLRKPFKAPKLC